MPPLAAYARRADDANIPTLTWPAATPTPTPTPTPTDQSGITKAGPYLPLFMVLVLLVILGVYSGRRGYWPFRRRRVDPSPPREVSLVSLPRVRRSESGRSIHTLPEYTAEAGEEEVVLLRREVEAEGEGSATDREGEGARDGEAALEGEEGDISRRLSSTSIPSSMYSCEDIPPQWTPARRSPEADEVDIATPRHSLMAPTPTPESSPPHSTELLRPSATAANTAANARHGMCVIA